MRKKYQTLVTYGTFDLFHVGHTRLLSRLSDLAERVVVGCSADEFNAIKGKHAIVPYEQRVEMLQSCRFVADVFAEKDWAQKRDDIVRFQADAFAMGDDWRGKFDDLSDLCDVVYLARTKEISTTVIKRFAEEGEVMRFDVGSAEGGAPDAPADTVPKGGAAAP